MKKRILSVLTVCALVFSLAACSQTPSENTAQEQSETQTEIPIEIQTETQTEISTETSAETQKEAQSEAQTEEQTEPQTEVQTENQSEMSEESRGSSEEAADGANVLIAYFSWSGNTAEIASYIQEKTGGDVLEIEPLNPYPTDYSEAGDVAERERDENARPEIANLPEDISQYDTVFVGYPIWWHTAPMIIGTFLENYDLSGVEVYPFTQSGSMDVEQFENSMNFVRENAPGANVHDGLFARASDTAAIDGYLTENGFAE